MTQTQKYGLIVGLFVLAGVLFVAVRGCASSPNDNVPAATKQLTAQEKQAIQNNPNIPPGLKGMMMGQNGAPHPAGNAAGSGTRQ